MIITTDIIYGHENPAKLTVYLDEGYTIISGKTIDKAVKLFKKMFPRYNGFIKVETRGMGVATYDILEQAGYNVESYYFIPIDIKTFKAGKKEE